jgi:hypothetical protein
MKKILLSLTCVTGLVASAGAQVFQSETARNILIGSIAGAIIGENNDKPLEGALIGAAAGGLWSAATVPVREQRSYAPPEPERYHQHRDYGYRRKERSCDSERRVIVVTPPRCEPPPRRVVIIEPACPPPRRSVEYSRCRHRDCDDRVVVVPSRGRVVYVTPGYGHCR